MPVDSKRALGQMTALLIAVSQNHEAMVQWLVEEAGASVHVKDEYCRGAKEVAQHFSHPGLVTYFEKRELAQPCAGKGTGGGGGRAAAY